MTDEQDKYIQDRQGMQAQRSVTTERRLDIQKAREKIYENREELLKIEAGLEQEAKFLDLQDEIQEIQKQILQLQLDSHAEQDEVNRLRRLADGYEDQIQGMAEDAQTRDEYTQTVQENLQRLREDLQRRREENSHKAREKRDQKQRTE